MKGHSNDLVVAFYLNARGFAYAVFEGSSSLVDCGTADAPRRLKTQRSIRRLAFLVDRYKPDAIVIREMPGRSRAHAGFDLAAVVARRRGIRVLALSRAQIRQAFAAVVGMPTRYAIATAIARHIPTFARLLPPPRKIWNGEDKRMGLFDAAALALAFFDDFSGWEASA
jgi:hypothetical protein